MKKLFVFTAFILVIIAFAMPPRPGLHLRGKEHGPAPDFGLLDRIAAHQKSATINLRIPIILMNYNNTSTMFTDDVIDSVLFEAQHSITEYYSTISFGKISVTGDVFGWYEASEDHDYYGGDTYTEIDPYATELVSEACQLANSDVDFSNYDSDDDGYVDVVVVIHQGQGQEESGEDTDIWSHQWELPTSLSMDGVTISTYTMQPERQRYIFGSDTPGSAHPSTIGVFCHELGHALGLWDYYFVNSDAEGLGWWCLMAAGSWNALDGEYAGLRPAHICPYGKIKLGIISPVVLEDDEKTLAIRSYFTAGVTHKIRFPHIADEYFLTSFYDKDADYYSEALPGEGLMIWHIRDLDQPNRDPDDWVVDIEEASGTQHLELTSGGNRGDEYDPWYYSNATDFTENSSPNTASFDGMATGVEIYNISANTDTVMTADFTVPQAEVAGCLSSENLMLYPNPFILSHQQLTFKFELCKNGDLTINIFDAGYNLVRTLVDNQLYNAGVIALTWDGNTNEGRRVVPGVYFVVVETSEGEFGKAAVIAKFQ